MGQLFFNSSVEISVLCDLQITKTTKTAYNESGQCRKGFKKKFVYRQKKSATI